MSQKNARIWMIGTIIGFSPWFVVWSVVDWFMHKDLASVFSTMVSLIVALVVVLALGNKYPSLRAGTKGFALGMVVFAIAGFVVPFVVYPQIYGQFNPHFKIVDVNYTSQYPTGYTYYARIGNDGIGGSQVVTCVVTKADLKTVSKSQTLYLSHNEEKIISFYFSATEVGTEWEKYTIQIGS